jgi:hypothetical protein
MTTNTLRQIWGPLVEKYHMSIPERDPSATCAPPRAFRARPTDRDAAYATRVANLTRSLEAQQSCAYRPRKP